jgi:hypothetical protein
MSPVKKQPAKVAKVMKEYKSGTLHSGKGGPVVKSKKQAVAIALSEAGMGRKKMVEKKTGEKYSSKSAKMKHERSESKAERKREYGKKK